MNIENVVGKLFRWTRSNPFKTYSFALFEGPQPPSKATLLVQTTNMFLVLAAQRLNEPTLMGDTHAWKVLLSDGKVGWVRVSENSPLEEIVPEKEPVDQ